MSGVIVVSVDINLKRKEGGREGGEGGRERRGDRTVIGETYMYIDVYVDH